MNAPMIDHIVRDVTAVAYNATLDFSIKFGLHPMYFLSVKMINTSFSIDRTFQQFNSWLILIPKPYNNKKFLYSPHERNLSGISLVVNVYVHPKQF